VNLVSVQSEHSLLDHSGPTGSSEMKLVLLERVKKVSKKRKKSKETSLATDLPGQTANQHAPRNKYTHTYQAAT
jgi:hypothetical protein